MGKKGEEPCTPCCPHPDWQPVFPDIVLSTLTGHPVNKAAQEEMARTKEPHESLLLPCVPLEAARDGSPSSAGEGQSGAQKQTFPRSPTWGTG